MIAVKAFVIGLYALSAMAGRSKTRPYDPDSGNYASSALQDLVSRAAVANDRVPDSLQAYQAHAESELTFFIRRVDGSEAPVQVEQVASTVNWQRTGAYTQHVIGYRARLAGPNLSALSIIHQAWTVPVLYGNRLALFGGRDSTRRRAARDTLIAVVHPLANDRDSVYEYAGGDTVLTIRTATRAIPVAVVHVSARANLARRTAVFIGDLYLDATRYQIVRMRGRFDVVGGHHSVGERLQSSLLQGAVFVDLSNAEFYGEYWLPSYQRIEAQIASPFTGDTRTGFRVVSHFADYTVTTDTVTRAHTDSIIVVAPRDTDTMRLLPHHLTFAPADSVTSFPHWGLALGQATSSVTNSDFNTWLPDIWRTNGPPRFALATQSLSDLVHFDRVEGLYTGVGAQLQFRDAAPGLTLRGNAGYAWTEGTVRGSLETQQVHGAWTYDLLAARALDNTNDFTTAFTSGPGLEALILQDDYDYVDRRRITISAMHRWSDVTSSAPVLTRFAIGFADDNGDRARLTRGIFTPSVLLDDSLFRPNRNVAPGTYVRETVSLDYNPGVDAGFVRAGLGARLRNEVAEGELSWDRAETRLVANEVFGPMLLGARLDAGWVTGTRIPPQQLFEIGYDEGLFAYDYKQFGGNRAAVLQEQAVYALPIFRAPVRVFGFIFPSPSPAIALEAHHGWADASTFAARLSLQQLGDQVNPATNAILTNPLTNAPYPVSVPTDGVRTSTDLTLRLFGNSVAAGVAEAIAPGARLQFYFQLGSTL